MSLLTLLLFKMFFILFYLKKKIWLLRPAGKVLSELPRPQRELFILQDAVESSSAAAIVVVIAMLMLLLLLFLLLFCLLLSLGGLMLFK